MPAIVVTSEELQSLSGQVANGSTNIQDLLGQLSKQVDSVVGQNWQGAASGQFNSLYTEWQTSAKNLQSALEGISQLLSSAASHYQNTEDAIKASMA